MPNQQEDSGLEVPQEPKPEPYLAPIASTTLTGKLREYGKMIGTIFAKGSDAEVAQVAKRIRELKRMVADLELEHDRQFDQISTGIHPERGDLVTRMRKKSENSSPVVAAVVVEVSNDPLAGEF